jgi:outer membrane protein OmpA-like peptidoglycan-associated protein/tetratricopeptide (TPR) repeat protein
MMTMTHFKKILILLILTQALLVKGQSVEKANDFHRSGYFAAAIPLYESALKKKSSSSVKSKLADCFHKLNQTEKAAKIYSEMVADSSATAIDYFRFGEVMMMQGNYDSARILYNKFLELKPEDEKGLNMIKALDNVKNIKPLLLNVKLQPFTQNSNADEHAPQFYQNGIVFAGDRNRGTKLLKQTSQTTGRDYYDIWYAQRINDSTYSKPKTFSKKLSKLNQNTGNACFTGDFKEVFFCRNNDVSSKGGIYKMQLYSAESIDGGKSWRNVEKLPFCSPETNYMYPSVSQDGKHLFYTVDKGENNGGLEIYVVHRTNKGWSRPESLGANVNTPAHECFPFIAPNGKLYFSSKGHIGYGGFDLFVTEQDSITGNWLTPRNLGLPLNSAYDDISISFKDSIHGAFSSPRNGQGDDIYFFTLLTDEAKTEDMEALVATKNFVFYDNKKVDSNLDGAGDISSLLGGEDEAVQTSSQAYLDSIAAVIVNLRPKESMSFMLKGVAYDSLASFEVSPSIAVEVEKLAGLLSIHRYVSAEIAIHTEGGASDAKEISRKRAEAIMQFLIQEKGITPTRLKAKGYGNSKLLKDCKKENCTLEEDIQINRRVEIILTGLKPQ